MEHNINETIAVRRRTAGLTQEQLGAKLGISGQAVSKWEKGESMPDILLLPELCDILGITVDALLGHQIDPHRDIMQEFCAMARREGRSKTLLEALGALFNDAGINWGDNNTSISADDIRVCDATRHADGEGMGFILAGRSMQETLRTLPAAEVAYFLRPLGDETSLAVLGCTSFDRAVTEAEICEAVGIDEATADRILLGLIKRNILTCDADTAGKRGYLQSANMVGVYMALAGCRQTDFGGEGVGNIWFSRR